mmetsp:Transcript_9537/g.43186  ORF Transcript_9537/g.43186 Transcript_9537/m.43186 type:complete len:221 (-) Transcript_9537:12-674(-)
MLALLGGEKVAEHVRLGSVRAEHQRRRRGEARECRYLVQSAVQRLGQRCRGLEESLFRVVGGDPEVRSGHDGRRPCGLSSGRSGSLYGRRPSVYLRHPLRDFTLALLRGSLERAPRANHVLHGADHAHLARDTRVTRVGVPFHLQGRHLRCHPLLDLVLDHGLDVYMRRRGLPRPAAAGGVGEVARHVLDGHEHRPSEAERGDEPRKATARGEGCGVGRG